MHSFYSSISRTNKKILFVTLDLIMLPLALWSSIALRFGELWPVERMVPFWWMFVVVPLVGVSVFTRLGLYRAVVRFMGFQAMIAILKGVLFLSLVLYALAALSEVEGFPRSVPINFAIIAGLYISATRFLVRSYYHQYIQSASGKEPVLIYGAGDAGTQLLSSIINTRQFDPVGFVDDDALLQGHEIQGLPVYSPTTMKSLVEKRRIRRVLLAVPSASRSRRREILDVLKPHPVHVQTIPSFSELLSGSASFGQLKDIEVDDLLGREPVPPHEGLLSRSIANKVVMVTGAGGSIGSELCRQILKLHPRQLILYEISEFALYSIEREVVEQVSHDYDSSYEIVALLGSVLDRNRLDKVIGQFGVQTIYHAAAYKHVPMVEHNVLEGVRNNVLGTRVVAEAALAHDVERFILISTDKAVRPTNVMGATKRSAEQVIQNLAAKSHSTIFSMVRFGNVLGSSGSVVPLFRRQIAEGGPISLTHEEIVRYFMTIPEAAQLVIQAGAMAQGGDVFVLDMGEPVKIYDLARNMIQLSGLSVFDGDNPDGDIAINVTGLRPGEKLYEELLLGENVTGTEHLRIMRAHEAFLGDVELREAIAALECAIHDNDPDSAREILTHIVKDYTPSARVVDHLRIETKVVEPDCLH